MMMVMIVITMAMMLIRRPHVVLAGARRHSRPVIVGRPPRPRSDSRPMQPLSAAVHRSPRRSVKRLSVVVRLGRRGTAVVRLTELREQRVDPVVAVRCVSVLCRRAVVVARCSHLVNPDLRRPITVAQVQLGIEQRQSRKYPRDVWISWQVAGWRRNRSGVVRLVVLVAYDGRCWCCR